MKVAVWNGISESDSVAGYVAALGMMIALEKNCNIILSSNYISNRMAHDCFSRRMLEDGIAHIPYCYLYGSPEYYSALWRMKRKRQDNILEIPMKGITIIFPPDMDEKSMFYYKSSSKNFYFLDMAKGSIAESKNVLDEAELVIVFLSQDKTEIRNFFERFSSLLSKAFFVIVDYQRDSLYTSRKISAEYGIKLDNIGIIYHNREFEKACEEGNLGQFIFQNLHRTMEEQNNRFIASLKKLARKIQMWGLSNDVEE